MKTLCLVLLGLNMFIFVTSFPFPQFDWNDLDDFADFLDMVQSPIAISTRDSIIEDNMKPLEFHGHWKREGNATLLNTGKTAKVSLRGRSKQPYITGGPLESDERYIFEQMHFHWSRRDEHGSEHVVDGKTYSMEVHLVHFNKKYGTYKKSVNKKDGLAVVTFFIQARGDKNYHDFSKITNHVPKVHQPLTRYTIDSDCLQWMKSQELSKHYYSYHGSLTTPPYDESVTWIIYQTPVYVSKRQVDVFRHLRSKDNKKIASNNRPLQRPDKVPTVIFARNTRSTSFF